MKLTIKKLQIKLLPLLVILITFIAQVFIYRDLIAHLNNRLLDWNDYPLTAFITTTQSRHLLNLQFNRFFESLMFYPHHQHSLLFSDLFIPQALINLSFLAITKQVILSFNLTFITTLLLNTIGSYNLWRRRFNRLDLLLATLLTAISPYLLENRAHFQILSIWPMLFGLAFIFKNKLEIKDLAILSLWLIIQFYASIYLFVFMGFLVSLWFGLKIIRSEARLQLIKQFLLLIIFSFLGAAYGLINYLQVQYKYGISYKYSEYVQYAKDLASYLQIPLGIFFLFTLGLWQQWRRKRLKKQLPLFFLLSMIIGFIFSLGPRLTVGGHYTAWRLPYDLVLKLVPLFKPIRATARWSWLFHLGLTYFAIIGFQYLRKRHLKLSLLVFGLTLMQLIPADIKTKAKDYWPDIYQPLKARCVHQDDVLLEYPLNYQLSDATALKRVEYWSQIVFAITYHQCLTVNGYSGYFPEIYKNKKLDILDYIDDNQIELIKFNKKYIKNEELLGYISIYQAKIVDETDEYVLIDIDNE